MEEREERRLRIKWTPNLNEKFNEAIRRLGEKATAIPILEYMSVPQLNRKQVENRLQQYRVQKRQAQLAQDASSSLGLGNHPNVLNSHEFLMNFNTPPQEPSLPQAHAISSLVPPNEFFTGLDDLIQNLEFDLYFKMSENQIDTYQSKPHLNMFNHMQDNRNPSNIQNSSEFHINFNKSIQQGYLLPQPPPLPSLVPPNNFFAGLNVWNQNVGLNYFNGNMIENQISTYFNTDNGNHSNVWKTKDLTMNFNEPHQDVYLPQPPVIPPNDLFTSLEDPFGSNPTQDNIYIRNQNFDELLLGKWNAMEKDV